MSVSFKKKMPLAEAQVLAAEVVDLMRRRGLEVQVCGSIRREKAEVGDIDLVVKGDLEVLKLSFCFECFPDQYRWVEGGTKKATLEFRGQQVNVLRSDDEHWGAAILYFTGPHDYNIGMRRKAKSMGLKLNERGL